MNNYKLNKETNTENKKITFHLFDENKIENNLHKDLEFVEKLVSSNAEEITLCTCSSLILICLPILKKIKNLKKIILEIKKGSEPSELLRIAQILRAKQIPVRVKYRYK